MSEVKEIVFHGVTVSADSVNQLSPTIFYNSPEFALRHANTRRKISAKISLKNPVKVNGMSDGISYVFLSERKIELLKSQGYDGVIVNYPNGVRYTVFNPEQVSLLEAG